MLKTVLTAAWSRKRRFVGTASAVVLGVAFLSATLVLGDTVRAGFRTAFATANAGTDAFVRSANALTGAEERQRTPIDAGVLDIVVASGLVAAAVPTVDGTAQVLDRGGDPIGGNGPPTIGTNWIDDPSLSGWDLAAGRAPAVAGEVVLGRATAADAEVGIGQRVTVLVPAPVEVTVVGLATFGDEDSIGGPTFVAFTTEEAKQRLLGSERLLSGVAVAARDGVSQEELAAQLGGLLPAGVEALTGTELTREQVAEIEGDFLGFVTTALLVFALVALVVAGFSIFNTFSILTAQRARESALLRALGASRRQVLGSAVAESAVVGGVGSVLGVLSGGLVASGLLALMDNAGFGLPTEGLEISAGSVASALVAGLVVTVLAALAPAVRASRVAPVAALREAAIDTSGSSRPRTVVGALAAIAGSGLVLAGTSNGDGLGRAGLGAVALVVGLVLLGPALARPIGSLLGAPLARRGVSGELARRNAVRNPTRTASTAAALLVGVGVVSLFTVFGASVSKSIEQSVDRSFGGELVLTPAGSGFSGAGIGPELVDGVAGLPEVESVAGLGFGAATLDGRQEGIGFADPVALSSVADLEVTEGDLGSVGDNDVAVAADYAEEHGLAIGDVIEAGFVDGATETLTLAVTYDARAIGGDVLVPQALWARHNPRPSYFLVLVGLAEGVSLDQGRTALEAVTEGTGSPDILDREEFVASHAAEIDVLLTVIYALLGVAVLIALMGIANTLSLSVHERSRELALLRAVGQTRAQMRAMVRYESVIVATFGSICGLFLGLFLGWGLVRALSAAQGVGTLAVPVGQLAVILLVGAGAGLLAGLRPARRASRLDILTAVADG